MAYNLASLMRYGTPAKAVTAVPGHVDEACIPTFFSHNKTAVDDSTTQRQDAPAAENLEVAVFLRCATWQISPSPFKTAWLFASRLATLNNQGYIERK